MLEQAPRERKILEQALRTRMPIPERIQNAPILITGLELHLNAWFDLSSCRQIGMGEGPIPWSEIEHYGRALALDDDTLDDLHYYVRAMDTEYFKFREAQRDSAGSG